MLQRLFLFVVVVGLGWLLRRVFGQALAQSAPPGAVVPPEASGGRMVRDRVCNTFLPRSSALSSHLDGEEHFFCSERCRRSFLNRGT